jgi:peptidoglycan LD-endopeptidase LytH
MLRGVLLFIAGVLVGANVVYFVMTREARTSAPPALRAGSQPAPAVATDAERRSAPPPSAATAPAVDAQPMPRITAPAATAPAPTNALLLPVQGVTPAQLTDTYNDLRGGTRIHEALDIMAPRGTPVLAAVDGRVEKLFTSAQGGITLYQFDATRTYCYYYAHLERYAPGIAEGQVLRRGQLLGYVGSTGNASPDAPHLHFAIFLLGPEKQWWKGAPVNPYPLLRGG